MQKQIIEKISCLKDLKEIKNKNTLIVPEKKKEYKEFIGMDFKKLDNKIMEETEIVIDNLKDYNINNSMITKLVIENGNSINARHSRIREIYGRNCKIIEDIDFKSAEIDKIDISYSHINGYGNFHGIKVLNNFIAKYVKSTGISLVNSKINGKVEFEKSEINRKYMTNAYVKKDYNINSSEIGMLNANNIKVGGNLLTDKAKIKELKINNGVIFGKYDCDYIKTKNNNNNE